MKADLTNPTRRQLLTAGATAGAALSLGVSPSRAAPIATLREIADKKGLIYGVATSSGRLAEDKIYADLIAQQANYIVAEGETKRGVLQPARNRFSFSGAEKIYRFATKNNQRMRGHTLVWHLGNPEWLTTALKENPSDGLVTDYVDTVCKHFKGRFPSWDVVNEAIAPDQGHPDGLRMDSVWYQAFGERYIDLAFEHAHAADPDALLFLNEGMTELDAWWSQAIRTSTLKLIDRLLARNVPISGFGIEGHLYGFQGSYSDEVLSKFMDELIARGLKIMITELDVADIKGPQDPVKRDADVASLTKRVLDVAFSKPECLGCLTWGITDKYSWFNTYPDFKWPDGQLARGLPFDQNYKPKPMFDAMMAAYNAR